MKLWALCIVVGLVGCQKKEEAAPAPSAAPAPPPPAAPAPEPVAAAPAPPAATAEPAASAAPTETAGAVPPAGAQGAPAVPAAAAAKASPAPSASGSPDDKKLVAASGAGLTACCTSLTAASKKEGPHKNRYTAAVAVCNGLNAQIKKGAANADSARVTMRAQLTGVPVPSGC